MDKIDTTCEHIRLRLIAAAVGLQQCTKTDGNEVLIPGTDKRILIGSDAYLAQVAARATQPREQAVSGSPHDVVIALREYADNPGYSHNDYADTMRQAAHCIESLRAMFYHYGASTGAAPEALASEQQAAVVCNPCTSNDVVFNESRNLNINDPAATTASASADYDCYNCGGKESAHNDGCPSIRAALTQQSAAQASSRPPFDFDEWFNEHSEGAQIRSGKDLRDFERAINEWASGAAQASHAGADTERLDWLENSGHAYVTHGGEWVFSDMPFGWGMESLREAIDSDRTATSAATEQKEKP